MKRFVLALDQGTTSSRAIVFDRESRIVSLAQKEYRQIYPRGGWVEHDPRRWWPARNCASTTASPATERIAQTVRQMSQCLIAQWNEYPVPFPYGERLLGGVSSHCALGGWAESRG